MQHCNSVVLEHHNDGRIVVRQHPAQNVYASYKETKMARGIVRSLLQTHAAVGWHQTALSHEILDSAAGENGKGKHLTTLCNQPEEAALHTSARSK